jgi:hypothetical protein
MMTEERHAEWKMRDEIKTLLRPHVLTLIQEAGKSELPTILMLAIEIREALDKWTIKPPFKPELH